ncbi:MAG: cobaltochelatase subunit CobN [Hyphomicrobiaceae bacterium]
MHLLVQESTSLDDLTQAEDVGLAPADVAMLSFSDSDLTAMASAWRSWPEQQRPSLRLANLARLRHPMSVDLFVERTLLATKAMLVRLLGGVEYWRYGCEELARRCRELGTVLAFVSGDGRPDPRLSALSTLSMPDLAAIQELLDAGGTANARAVLSGLQDRATGGRQAFAAPETPALWGRYLTVDCGTRRRRCAVVFYRSSLLAADTAPVDALCAALEQHGLAPVALFVPSLKAPEAAAWLRRELTALAPDVVVNATAFSARDDDTGSPLDAAGCPVLQVALAGQGQAVWNASARGLGAADLAMHVVLPEMDGRLFAGAISFKEPAAFDHDLSFAPMLHRPYADGIRHVADLARAWSRLRATPREKRKIALLLSTYPGRADQIAHAVGLDGPASAVAIAQHLAAEGFAIADAPGCGAYLIARLTDGSGMPWPLAAYEQALQTLPSTFVESVTGAWGDPGHDPSLDGGVFKLNVHRCGNLLIGLQPERGDRRGRKRTYHDPNLPPRHGYVAFYLWLRQVGEIDALIHLGAHGTLEWLPGKAVALAGSCAPRAILGALPTIYPFIVNDPGEAAQAKRRLGAVTLGHRTPPLRPAELSDDVREVERLVDEFASADGLDPRRRKRLVTDIPDAVARAGIGEACGLADGLSEAETLARIDAFLCDIKELTIRDGLHVLDAHELGALVRALDGCFIAPGPAGAPSRGRPDVLPTGRNLYSVDPRALPTPTAADHGARAAQALLDRYVADQGDWPRAVVLDLWGSAGLRTGGEELATALALLGVRPTWDNRSFRVAGFEIVPPVKLGRPRVDVTVRISGLFRDLFPAQLALFDAAVQRVAALREEPDMNPLAAWCRNGERPDRIFGAAAGAYGSGVMERIDAGDWQQASDLGETYLAASATAYRGDGTTAANGQAFAERVRTANAFLHIQDHRETDLLTGSDFAAHEGGFAAAAAALGNKGVALYHGDTGNPQAPRMRTLVQECARVVHGRAANPLWIAGQMRHGFRGAAELSATVDAAFAFAATSGSITNSAFERLYDAYLGDPTVAAFLSNANPAAAAAMRKRFAEAIARGLWHPRRNDVAAASGGPI